MTQTCLIFLALNSLQGPAAVTEDSCNVVLVGSSAFVRQPCSVLSNHQCLHPGQLRCPFTVAGTAGTRRDGFDCAQR